MEFTETKRYEVRAFGEEGTFDTFGPFTYDEAIGSFHTLIQIEGVTYVAMNDVVGGFTFQEWEPVEEEEEPEDYDDEPAFDIEMGFDPYAGCYSDDC